MCILAAIACEHPLLKAVIWHNRDEYFDRPTYVLDFCGDTGILCGRDRERLGTWFGLHVASGEVVALTNMLEERFEISPQSRGQLVVDLLTTPHGLNLDEAASYTGFNLLQTNVSREDSIHIDCCHNWGCSAVNHDSPTSLHHTCGPESLEEAVVLSNGRGMDLTWPKIEYAKQHTELVVKEALHQPSLDHTATCALPLDGRLEVYYDPSEQCNKVRRQTWSEGEPHSYPVPQLWLQLRDRLAGTEVMSAKPHFPSATHADLSYTSLDPAYTKILQQDLFLHEIKRYGTRSQSLLLVGEQEVLFCERDTRDGFGEWHSWVVDYHKARKKESKKKESSNPV